ncbi:MAG: PEP-CTERM sorting domain-containing protein [Gloeobacteraceae cyanobacterium ES-bin-144]|nr:PEP-CTERM sorting domain-containing protein [Verrucomicrobiales bacterium]
MKTKSSSIFSALILSAALSQVQGAALIPLLATGWNQDIVLGLGDPVAGAGAITGGRTDTMDGGNGQATWYGVGYNTAAPLTGLPTGPTLSATSGADLTFQLQPFVGIAASVNNAIYNGGTLSLTAPTPLARLAIIGSTGNGTADITVTVNYADATTETFGPGLGAGVNADWFASATSLTFIADGRINTSDGNFQAVGTGNWRLYENIFTLGNTTSNVVSVDITDGGSGNSAIMAISGEAIPEPSTFGLLGLSAAGIFLRRRRA